MPPKPQALDASSRSVLFLLIQCICANLSVQKYPEEVSYMHIAHKNTGLTMSDERLGSLSMLSVSFDN